jgi:hypothetical protein
LPKADPPATSEGVHQTLCQLVELQGAAPKANEALLFS